VRDPIEIPERRPARTGDRLLISVFFAAILTGWLRLPELVPNIPWQAPSTGILANLVSYAPGKGQFALSIGMEMAVLTAAFLAFQSALLRFDLSRLRLTRPLFGTTAGVTLVVLGATVLAGLNLRAVLLPVGLASLWVSASFGLGAGLVTVIMTVALCALSGMGDVLAVPVLVRLFALVLIFRGGLHSRDGLRAGAWAGVLASCVIAASLISEASVSRNEILAHAFWGFAGGLLDGLLYLLTRGLGERLLGHVSRERLVALLDLSQPLLQRMVHRAPGSFEHSRAMANLAEQAASSIGADALLTRVGAYYHDLGKSVEPKFFVENLDAGETSKHEGLTPTESAAKILRHVTDGVKILRQGGIPEPVVEFAYTHHGSQRVEYFLKKEKERVDDEEAVDVRKFQYPGMKPGTRETAILMLVDSIEAASRTIDSPDRERLEDMVRRIVFSKLAAEQLDESGLTLQELRTVCSRAVETLVHMNHHRIKYPWQEERARQFGIGERELSPQAAEAKNYPRAVGKN